MSSKVGRNPGRALGAASDKLPKKGVESDGDPGLTATEGTDAELGLPHSTLVVAASPSFEYFQAVAGPLAMRMPDFLPYPVRT